MHHGRQLLQESTPTVCRAKARTRGGQPCQASPVRGKKALPNARRPQCGPTDARRTGAQPASSLGAWPVLREAIEARRRANWETLEQGVARIRREERRAERLQARHVRRLTREIDRLIGV